MTGTLPLLLLLACLCLVGFLLTGLSLARARKLEEKRRRRFAEVLGAHARQRAPDPLRSIVIAEAAATSRAARLAGLFGFAPGRAHIYPIAWPVALLLCLALAVLLAWVATFLLGPAGWLAALALWPFSSRSLFGWAEQRRTGTLFRQFPDALAMIVRGVRVGIPVTDTIRAVGAESPSPTAEEFVRLANELAIGVPLDEALRTMAERNSMPEYRFFATAMALQSQTGGRLSETLENLADVIRKRVAVRARGYALAAEARTSSIVLALLPFIAFGGLMLLSPAYARLLFTDPSGRIVLAAALLTLGTGLFAMRTLIRRSLS